MICSTWCPTLNGGHMAELTTTGGTTLAPICASVPGTFATWMAGHGYGPWVVPMSFATSSHQWVTSGPSLKVTIGTSSWSSRLYQVVPTDAYWQHLWISMQVRYVRNQSQWFWLVWPVVDELRLMFDWCSRHSTTWWPSYPSEKYEFVNWDDDIPNTWENESHVPNHQPAIISEWINVFKVILQGNNHQRFWCSL